MNRLNDTFVYRPTAGDRVFAERTTPAGVILRWSNGCRTAVGHFTHLEYVACASGAWWRDAATNAAKAVVLGSGGLAWDEQGTIHLLVPAWHALQADEIMERVCVNTLGPAHATYGVRQGEADALAHGYAGIGERSGRLVVEERACAVANRPAITWLTLAAEYRSIEQRGDKPAAWGTRWTIIARPDGGSAPSSASATGWAPWCLRGILASTSLWIEVLAEPPLPEGCEDSQYSHFTREARRLAEGSGRLAPEGLFEAEHASALAGGDVPRAAAVA